jgi:hypothetical protein
MYNNTCAIAVNKLNDVYRYTDNTATAMSPLLPLNMLRLKPESANNKITKKIESIKSNRITEDTPSTAYIGVTGANIRQANIKRTNNATDISSYILDYFNITY